ncbi:MAG: GNAT family N-acetyltransferase [Candidatus Dadabacteria bacterium]|nr:GNAT family N-acetyltransferase [Candidatus Dadabacteria bacterium]
MEINVSELTQDDFDSIDELMKKNSRTLGFLPKDAILFHIDSGGCLGVKTEDGRLAGYILFATYSDRFRIVHLCVSKEHRGKGIAKTLVENLKEKVTTQKSLVLHCRSDFEVNNMWPNLGFVWAGDKPGRALQGSTLDLWRLTLVPDDQLSLFQIQTSDESLDVVIDAQVFFDFLEEDSPKSIPSKALLADFLVDRIRLCITDEIFNEISRNKDPQKRRDSLSYARTFPRLEPTSNLVEHFEESLMQLLPHRSPSQQSDVRHLAKTAASDVKTFITKDTGLSDKREDVFNLTGVQILSPTELIIDIDGREQNYTPSYVSGLSLSWNHLESSDLDSLYDTFLEQGERRGQLRERIGPFLSDPTLYTCEILKSDNQSIMIRVLTKESDAITVHFGRVAMGVDRSLYDSYLVINTIHRAVDDNLHCVKFQEGAVPTRFVKHLQEKGFVKNREDHIRFSFPLCLNREEVLAKIGGLSPESKKKYEDMGNDEIERCCSPVDLDVDEKGYFLIPIHPAYAVNLFNRKRSSSGLLRGELNVLLPWDNVYYKTKSHHHMLKPPARILWYESGSVGAVTAVSRLDEVNIGVPKDLFKRFKKFGILEWRDIYNMCEGDVSREIMALQFSNTFVFPHEIALSELRKVAEERGIDNISLQSPLRIDREMFQKLYNLGWATQ